MLQRSLNGVGKLVFDQGKKFKDRSETSRFSGWICQMYKEQWAAI